MGPLARRILHDYWYRLRVVDCMGGYHREEFHYFWGWLRGTLSPPIIFNVMVDAALHHWILLVAVCAGGKDVWGREVIYRDAFSYKNDVLVALTDPVWLQGSFDTLTTGYFDRVGI